MTAGPRPLDTTKSDIISKRPGNESCSGYSSLTMTKVGQLASCASRYLRHHLSSFGNEEASKRRFCATKDRQDESYQ